MHPPDPSVVYIDGPWRHLQVHAHVIRFPVVDAERSQDRQADKPDRSLVILLHDFASLWCSWRHLLLCLIARTGARVVAGVARG